MRGRSRFIALSLALLVVSVSMTMLGGQLLRRLLAGDISETWLPLMYVCLWPLVLVEKAGLNLMTNGPVIAVLLVQTLGWGLVGLVVVVGVPGSSHG